MGRVGAGAVRDSNVPAVSTERMSGELIFLFHGTARYKGWRGEGGRGREESCLLRKHVGPQTARCPVLTCFKGRLSLVSME